MNEWLTEQTLKAALEAAFEAGDPEGFYLCPPQNSFYLPRLDRQVFVEASDPRAWPAKKLSKVAQAISELHNSK